MLTLFGGKASGNKLANDTITSFSLREGGGMNRLSGFNYYVKLTQDGKVYFRFNEGLPDEKEITVDDRSVFDSLQQIILKHKMYKYSGNYQPPFSVTDGSSWDLAVHYASGYTISAGGYMYGPKGYRDAFNEIIQCLQHWKDLPSKVNEVVSFLYVYGKESYRIEREADHALLTYDNEETGEHKVLERELDVLEDLRILFNVDRLKMNGNRGKTDFECTLWMYDITYTNGDHYRYESYDRDYKCGYTHILQGFISYCMKEKSDRGEFYYR